MLKVKDLQKMVGKTTVTALLLQAQVLINKKEQQKRNS